MNVDSMAKKAAKGSGKAMRRLYDEFKGSAYFFCKLIAGEEKAGDAVRKSFAEAWKLISAEKGDTRGFESILQANFVKHSKNNAIPPAGSAAAGESEAVSAIKTLPDKQRIAVLMTYLYGTNAKAIAGAVKMNEDAVVDTVKAGRESMAKSLAQAHPEDGDKSIDIRLANIGSELRAAAARETVPQSVDEAVYADIEKRSTDHKLTKKQVIIVAIGAILIIAAFAAMFWPESIEQMRHVEIEIEGYGTIYVELDPNEAPITVENFISLAEEGFYDGLTIHRIVPGFVIQGGDPEGTGSGGSGEPIKGEFEMNGVENNISHTRGVISMARATDFDSATSQFFIVHEDSSSVLDGRYAAFGRVTEGMDIVDAIVEDAVIEDEESGYVAPENQPVIKEVRVVD